MWVSQGIARGISLDDNRGRMGQGFLWSDLQVVSSESGEDLSDGVAVFIDQV